MTKPKAPYYDMYEGSILISDLMGYIDEQIKDTIALTKECPANLVATYALQVVALQTLKKTIEDKSES